MLAWHQILSPWNINLFELTRRTPTCHPKQPNTKGCALKRSSSPPIPFLQRTKPSPNFPTTSGFHAFSTRERKWVAQVTLRGPLSAEEFHLPESGQPPAARDEEEEKWQMLSLYNLPSHRGKGLGKRLCKAACDFVVSRGGLAPTITVRCMVKPDNLATLGMYQSLGFERTGLCTLEEALRANGDADMIPEGLLDKKFTTRTGIILALRLRREN